MTLGELHEYFQDRSIGAIFVENNNLFKCGDEEITYNSVNPNSTVTEVFQQG